MTEIWEIHEIIKMVESDENYRNRCRYNKNRVCDQEFICLYMHSSCPYIVSGTV